MDSSHCILYAVGLYITLAFDDLSFKAVASQSNIFPGPTHMYAANNALDRNTATCMRTDQTGYNSVQKTTWWKVDLGGSYNINSISFLFKSYDNLEYRQRGRLAGFSLYVSKTGVIQGSALCYKDGPQLPPLNFTITCTEYGRYVIFYNERIDGVKYPDGYELTILTELCEVIVKGCKQSEVYGTNCDIPCSNTCKSNVCNIQSGECFDCKHGVYGRYCNLSCPAYCKNNTCHMQNGSCLECSPGVYGLYCNLSCPINCKGKTCNMQNGACLTCVSGWTGTNCNTKCAEGWYSVNCSQQCVGHCKDGIICNHVTGQCDEGCEAGWTGYICERECTDGTYGYNCVNNCSGHCLKDTTCNKHIGHCDRGCDPGYTDTYCTTKCVRGHFGQDCRQLCSGHCESNEPCDHVSGVCPGRCQDGYLEKYCNISCKVGNYGKNCSFPCPQSCNSTCSHIDGSCEYCKEDVQIYCPKEDTLWNHNVSSLNIYWIIGVSVSIVINLIFISCVCLLCRGIYTQKVFISRDVLSCSKRSPYYTDTNVKIGDNSTYQELDLSREEMPYENTTIQ